MDNNEARFLLRAYRPNGADAASADFAAALEQARRDPGLRAWFEREQAGDRAIAAKLKAVAPPAGLRESILTGAKFTARSRAWWRTPMWLSLAASMVLIASLASLWRYKVVKTDWSQVVAAVTDDALHGERHGSKGESADRLVALISEATAHLSAPMSIDLGRLKADGCRTFSIAHHEVMEVCFARNGGEFHLYVMKRPRPGDLPNGPQFASLRGVQSVMWTDPGHLYVLASTESEAALKALL